jgi:hypothetical protein
VNRLAAAGPVDPFFDLSVGSDYPGTLIRDDSRAQLKFTVDEWRWADRAHYGKLKGTCGRIVCCQNSRIDTVKGQGALTGGSPALGIGNPVVKRKSCKYQPYRPVHPLNLQ